MGVRDVLEDLLGEIIELRHVWEDSLIYIGTVMETPDYR